MRLVLLALLPACSLYFGTPHGGAGSASGSGSDGLPPSPPPSGPGTVTLTLVKSMAGAHQIAGIDSDGNGGLWIASRDPSAGTGSVANVWVDHLDAGGNKLSEWLFDDDATTVSGLAFTGDAVWLNYNENVVGSCATCRLRKLDAATGASVGSYTTWGGIADISYGERVLLLSSAYGEVLSLTLNGGYSDIGIVSPDAVPGGTQRGAAYNAGWYWIATDASDEIYIADLSGSLVATASTDVLPGGWGTPPQQFLAWQDETTLMIVADNQIDWLAWH